MSITILDGGMGQELLRRGHRGSQGLWSAQALIDAPDVVADVHRSYIDVGARVITTNTYSTVPSYLGKAGMADRYVELAWLAARIARNVPNAASVPVKVAGSVPTGFRKSTPDEYVAQARRWIDFGATIIGGCCGIGPDYILALSARLAKTAQ